MEYSFKSQCNKQDYFCLSHIDKQAMEKHGLNISIARLRLLARKSKPYKKIWTGSGYLAGMAKQTNVYRYEDFKKYA